MEDTVYKKATLKNGKIIITEIPLNPEPQTPEIKTIEEYYCPLCGDYLDFTSYDYLHLKMTPPAKCERCHQKIDWSEI